MTTGSGGMSLRKLAKGLGVSQPFLSQIRNGKRPMPSALKERVVITCLWVISESVNPPATKEPDKKRDHQRG